MNEDINEITKVIIGAAIAVHRELGPGQLEARLRAFAPLGYRPGLLALVGVDRLPHIPLARFSGLTSLWSEDMKARFQTVGGMLTVISNTKEPRHERVYSL